MRRFDTSESKKPLRPFTQEDLDAFFDLLDGAEDDPGFTVVFDVSVDIDDYNENGTTISIYP